MVCVAVLEEVTNTGIQVRFDSVVRFTVMFNIFGPCCNDNRGLASSTRRSDFKTFVRLVLFGRIKTQNISYIIHGTFANFSSLLTIYLRCNMYMSVNT